MKKTAKNNYIQNLSSYIKFKEWKKKLRLANPELV